MRAFFAFVSVFSATTAAQAASTDATTELEADRLEDKAQLPVERPERHVILMPVVGLWNHPLERDGWSTKAGPVWGVDVKIEPFSWLGVRASVLRGNQRLEIDRGLLVKDVDAYQPMLEITRLGVRVEPTLRLTETLSGYLGLGIAWGRFVAPETVTSPTVHTYNRTAVHVGYEGAVGFAYEPRRDRVVLDLSIAGAFLTNQSGTAYETVQGFTAAGHRINMGGLSKFEGGYRAMFGIGVIL